jgi:energy-coupling factor transporter ATP-binding protein EcfA2
MTALDWLPWTGALERVFGVVPAGPVLTLSEGYTVLVGANNAGKSTMLQALFSAAMRNESPFGDHRVCLLLPERGVVSDSIEVGGRQLRDFNREVFSNGMGKGSNPLRYDSYGVVDRATLLRLLLTHRSLLPQVTDLNTLLRRFGFPELDIAAGGRPLMADMMVANYGTGVRSLLPILAALTDSRLRLILIDEPETALEPRLQRQLRDLLKERAPGRAIVVATQSHLFLDRSRPDANHAVTRNSEDRAVAHALQDPTELMDLSFRLLGNSVEDLSFPGNFLVVEGASDQRIAEAVRNLLGAEPGQLKVVSASGVTQVGQTVASITHVLTPLVMRDSPYAKRVVALIDDRATNRDELRRVLRKRLFELGAASLEEYLPDELYRRVGLEKGDVLERVRLARGDYNAESAIKTDVSDAIAAVLTRDDLNAISVVRDAVQLALSKAS